MSNTRNVKLGVCTLFYKGVDLGYTLGGVEVTVKTDTHKVNIDQFGKSAINEYIMGREVIVKAPLAETTIGNLVATMPGATVASTGGAAATGTITIATNLSNNDTIVVNGATVTFKTVLTGAANEVQIGASAAASAVNLAAALNASLTGYIAAASYSVSGAIVTVTYGNLAVYGASGSKAYVGNTFTLSAGTAGVKVTLSGATLTGGVDALTTAVAVMTGIGVSLLDLAGELRLHPIGKAVSDLSEDFVVTLAGTAGALKFAYKLDVERVFDIEFYGYPDSNGKLFSVGA